MITWLCQQFSLTYFCQYFLFAVLFRTVMRDKPNYKTFLSAKFQVLVEIQREIKPVPCHCIVYSLVGKTDIQAPNYDRQEDLKCPSVLGARNVFWEKITFELKAKQSPKCGCILLVSSRKLTWQGLCSSSASWLAQLQRF